MNLHVPQILANVSGAMIVIFGVVYIVITFNSRGVAPINAMAYLIAGIAIVAAGVMNIVLAYGHVGRRSTIAANIMGLVCFAAAAYLTRGPSAVVGLILFALASICSPFVLGLKDRSKRYYPHRL